MTQPKLSALISRRSVHWLGRSAAELKESVKRKVNDTTSLSAVEASINANLVKHKEEYDNNIVLEGATNVVNKRVSAALGHTIGQQPSLGHPGNKHERGLAHSSHIEATTSSLLERLFSCKYAEVRPMSGAHAVLFGHMAIARPGDTVLSIPASAGGHATSRPYGSAGYYGLNVVDIAFDEDKVSVDMDGLRRQCEDLRPVAVILGTSLPLFPVAVEDVRDIADRTCGAKVMYDAAHVSGLTAGGMFQQPLREGAHIMTTSSYKSYGGPPGGFVLTDSDELMERLDGIAFPGLTANFNMARVAALAIATMDMMEHGGEYARAMVANAQRLALSLCARGVPMFSRAGGDFTDSHIIAFKADGYGGGVAVCDLLESAGILASPISYPLKEGAGKGGSGVRLGLAECTRRGMTEGDMDAIAELIGRAVVDGEDPAAVRRDAHALRGKFGDSIHFVRQ